MRVALMYPWLLFPTHSDSAGAWPAGASAANAGRDSLNAAMPPRSGKYWSRVVSST